MGILEKDCAMEVEEIQKERAEAVRRRDELRREVFELTERIHGLNRAEQKLCPGAHSLAVEVAP